MMYATRKCSTPLTANPARAAYSNASLSVALSATPCNGLSTMASYTPFLTVAKPCARRLWMDGGLGITARSGRPAVGVGSDGCPMTTLTRAEIGALGEQLAVDHLTSLGLRVLTRNWRCRYGGLDG